MHICSVVQHPLRQPKQAKALGGTWKMLVHSVEQNLMLMLKPPPAVSLTCSSRTRASLSTQQLLNVYMPTPGSTCLRSLQHIQQSALERLQDYCSRGPGTLTLAPVAGLLGLSWNTVALV
jgi:hypothetical protein